MNLSIRVVGLWTAAFASIGIYQTEDAKAHELTGIAGLQAGLLHPLTGVDHLLAMVAVGMVSVLLGGHSVWRVPAVFLAAMVGGAALGYAGWRIPYIELGIALSVLLLGLALVQFDLTGWKEIVFGCVAAFGLCHGHAHGLELPRAVAPFQFSFGFLLTSLFLHICGLFIAEMMSGARWRVRIRQAFGMLITAIGAWFVGSWTMAS